MFPVSSNSTFPYLGVPRIRVSDSYPHAPGERRCAHAEYSGSVDWLTDLNSPWVPVCCTYTVALQYGGQGAVHLKLWRSVGSGGSSSSSSPPVVELFDLCG
jgi:hypothetical protein